MAESGENHFHATMAPDAKATDAKSDASQERIWETYSHFIGGHIRVSHSTVKSLHAKSNKSVSLSSLWASGTFLCVSTHYQHITTLILSPVFQAGSISTLACWEPVKKRQN